MEYKGSSSSLNKLGPLLLCLLLLVVLPLGTLQKRFLETIEFTSPHSTIFPLVGDLVFF